MPLRLITQRIAQLYKQGADSVRIGQYVLRWVQWVQVRANVRNVSSSKPIKKICRAEMSLNPLCMNLPVACYREFLLNNQSLPSSHWPYVVINGFHVVFNILKIVHQFWFELQVVILFIMSGHHLAPLFVLIPKNAF